MNMNMKNNVIVTQVIQGKHSRMFCFELKNVMSVYLGKKDTCMCGCAGNYAYAKKNASLAGADRGYKIYPDEISDSKIRARITRFLKIQGPAENIKDCILTKYDGDRQITIYLKKVALRVMGRRK